MPQQAMKLPESPMDENERIAVAVLDRDVTHVGVLLAEFKTDVKTRFDFVDRRFDTVDKRFDALEKKFDGRFDILDKKFDGRCDALDKKIDGVKDWAIRIAVTLFGAIAASHLYLSSKMDRMAETFSTQQQQLRQDLSSMQTTLSQKIDALAVSVAESKPATRKEK